MTYILRTKDTQKEIAQCKTTASFIDYTSSPHLLSDIIADVIRNRKILRFSDLHNFLTTSIPLRLLIRTVEQIKDESRNLEILHVPSGIVTEYEPTMLAGLRSIVSKHISESIIRINHGNTAASINHISRIYIPFRNAVKTKTFVWIESDNAIGLERMAVRFLDPLYDARAYLLKEDQFALYQRTHETDTDYISFIEVEKIFNTLGLWP